MHRAVNGQEARAAAVREGAEQMARKVNSSSRKTNGRNGSKLAKRTVVRRSSLPRTNVKPAVITTPSSLITHEQIAERAYFISISGTGGSEQENWLRAERELREYGQKRPMAAQRTGR